MADGFLGRWSQRKAQVRAGIAPAEPEIVERAVPARPEVNTTAPPAQTSMVTGELPSEAAPTLPTLEEAQALDLNSDFKPFVVRGVDPVVRNAAMKKLFADPHFNVMDRMDTYIDDYSVPDPLSAIDLRQMASAQFLKLLDDEAPAAVSTPSVSSSDDHPDLQLQQDPASQSPGPGECAE